MFKNIEDITNELKKNGTIKFRIKVSANAKADLIDFCDETIKIKIKAPAVDGKANKALIQYLSKLTGISKSKIKIVNGEKSSIKTICVEL